ncbi:MAG: hypothetical protein B6245_07770 [Desulfobacteraceae bacterium 4572_88]|nr:MAG: hypothetical protein B6245_07770 [Desulfobacteraceae bacterium 4572_88]
MKKKPRKFDIRHKETLTLFLKEYFDLFFPDLAKKMRFETAEFLDKELISLFGGSENGGDRHKLTDALIFVQIMLDKKLEAILIHWEQESQKKKSFDERMFHYFCGIYYRHRRLILPIAMFTDPVKWRKPVKDTFGLSLPGYPINEFAYQLIKLKDYGAGEFEKLSEKNPLAAAYLPLTDYPAEDRPLIKAKAIMGITKVAQGRKQATLFSLIEESIRLNKEEEERFQKIIRDDPMYQEAKMLESIEELGMERGMEKGEIRALEKVTKNLLRSGKLTKKEIAQVTDLDIAEMNEADKETEETVKNLLRFGKLTEKEIAQALGLELSQVTEIAQAVGPEFADVNRES